MKASSNSLWRAHNAAARPWIFAMALVLLCGLRGLQAADFSVTTPNNQFAYLINGMNNNPTITLVRGKTYTFAINTAGDHPFAIATQIDQGAPPGVSGANGSSSGTITFKVPANAQDCVYYCTIHKFSGNIHMINPVTPPPPTAPPTVDIVGIAVGPNILLKTAQATTNGFQFIPEANSSLATTNWFALTVQSNRFSNGTNEIFCGKPPGTNLFLRVRIR
jgi:hypothetical protein